MTFIYKLRNFCRTILSSIQNQNKSPSRTYQAYANCLLEFLESIDSFVVKKEHIVLNLEENGERVSIMTLFYEMDTHFRMLKILYDIHQNSILNYLEHPGKYILNSISEIIKLRYDLLLNRQKDLVN